MSRRGAVVAASVLVLTGCGGRSGDAVEPAGPVERGGTDGDAVAATDGAPADRPCTPYVERGLRCAKEDRTVEAGDRRALADALRDECGGWLRGGATTDQLAAALDACESTGCADGVVAWHSCVIGGLPAAALSEPSVSSSAPAHLGTPRAIDVSADACAVFTSWMVACTRASSGGVEIPPENVSAILQAFAQVCDAWRAVPAIRTALPGVLRRCADVTCGSSGSDLVLCVTTGIAEAAAAAAGTPSP